MRLPFFKLSAALIALAVLSGCVSTTPSRMAVPEVVPATRSDTVLIFLQQREVEVDKPDVNAGGGLLGALVEGVMESTMDKNRQAALTPIRNGLIGLDFENRFVAMLKQTMPTSLVQESAAYTVVRSQFDLEAALVKVNGRNGALVSARYAFDQNFNALYVNTAVQFGDIGMVLNAKGKAQSKYKTQKAMIGKVTFASYSSHFFIPDAGGYEAGAAYWSANSGKPMLDAFQQSLDEIGGLIKRDLATPIVIASDAETRKVRFPGGGRLKGTLVESHPTNGRSLMALFASRIWTGTNAPK